MSPTTPTVTVYLDIAIIGGGIAGLWLANRLHTQGFNTAVFEHKALGSDQTIASQGMIHGGMKYTLSGALTGASEAIADMPEHWRACLCGEGDVDLRNTRILSDHFFLWSSNTITSRLTSFLASKTLRGRVDTLPIHNYPPLLRHADFKGNLYKLVDIVLDVPSLIGNLAHNIEGRYFQLDWSQARWNKDDQGQLSLQVQHNGQTLNIHAQRFIFTAGKGNGDLLAQLGVKAPMMQLRPLQQVMVKHYHPHLFYGHCLGADTTPRLTISSYKLRQHEYVWYLGGSLAEKGANMDAQSLIQTAKEELAELLPWINLDHAQWSTLPLTRAEPLQPNFKRPDHAFVEAADGIDNLLVAWPTKLTLAPNLANKVIALLQDADIKPGQYPATTQLQTLLPVPPLAQTPWEIAFPPAVDTETSLGLKFFVPDERQN